MKAKLQPLISSAGDRLRGSSLYPVAKSAYFGSFRAYSFVKRFRSAVYKNSPLVRRTVGPSAQRSVIGNGIGGINDVAPAANLNDIDPSALDAAWWTSGWRRQRVVYMDPGFAQPQLFRPHDNAPFYLYYEYRGQGSKWFIAVSTAEDVTGPYDIHHFPILSPSTEPRSPDYAHIADPTVLYFENRDPAWHMWFDMCDRHGVWRIGHATSDDGINWQKDTSNEITKTTLDTGSSGSWDDDSLHAPEAYIWRDQVRLLYNARGTGHTSWDAGLAVATNRTQSGWEFEKRGQLTEDDTTSAGVENRLKPPVRVGNILFSFVGSDGKATATVVRSTDGGESWETVTKYPSHMAMSPVVDDGKMHVIASDGVLHSKPLPNLR